MTTIANNPTPSHVIPFEDLLAKMEPHFRFFAKRDLRLKADNFDDALQEMRAIAFGIYRSLVRRGKEVFYTPIMKFAIKRYKSGRRFAGSSTKDILADQTRILGRSEVCSLSQFDVKDDNSLHFMVDGKSNVADTVQFKIDFEDWYSQQSPKHQQIIDDLAMSETTTAVAKKHGVTPAAISIKRKGFANSWKMFIDPPEAGMLVSA
jgi:hypothetical protein